jgi:hypothetical protein
MEEILLSGKPQDSEQVWPDTPDVGHADILMMMAPKPVLVLAAEYDFFPLEGTLKTVEQAKKFYSFYERADNLQLFIDNTPHTYSAVMAEKAAEFFALHFGMEKRDASDKNTLPVEMKKLYCTKQGQLLGDYRDAQTVLKTNQAEVCRIIADKQNRLSFEWLHDKVMEGRKACPLNIKYVQSGHIHNIRYSRISWNVQEEMTGIGVYFKSMDSHDEKQPVTVMLWEGGTCAVGKHFARIEDVCRKGHIAFVIDICGEGCLEPNPVNTMPLDAPVGALYTLNSHLARLGDSIAAMRVYDVLKAIEAAGVLAGSNGSVSLHAEGRHSLYAYLSALFHDGMKLDADDNLSFLKRIAVDKYYDDTNLQTLIIPGILRFLDIEGIMGCREKK